MKTEAKDNPQNETRGPVPTWSTTSCKALALATYRAYVGRTYPDAARDLGARG